jgi:glycine cleavage system aminomethyltransferase T
VAVNASPERARSALTDVLTRAGAVFARREGRPVVISFGSAAGELAACVSAAGMADSSQLTKLELCGPRARLAELVRQATGATVASGGVLQACAAWWCGCGAGGQEYVGAEPVIEPERVIVLGEPAVGRRLSDLLGTWVARTPGLVIHDRSDVWSAIAILGAATSTVLARLGVLGPSRDPRQVPPFHYAPLGELEAMWLLQSEHRALVLVRSAQADLAWHAIEQGGRPQRICCVGHDAMARYALLERRSVRGLLG